ncbi:glycosyltransferase family 1 protein [Microbacterium paraoxydans]|uniref:glycosyltransferase family 1 protein n=1 Tax=Microbacterium paraoxydans TaxID=199592 RepID=UPI001CFA593E|nr:glycosyltransferase family 1 protein [Microbacterium paraoxydans]
MDSLLIVSFSRLEQDARVRRQVSLFGPEYHTITAAHGPGLPEAAEHVELPLPPTAGVRRKARFYAESALLRLRLYRMLYWTDPTVRAARKALRNREYRRVIANDIEAVPLALSLAGPDRVHADLHEFYPGLHDDNPRWVALRRPYFDWLIRTYATRAASATTVGDGVRTAYAPFNLSLGIVTNAPAHRSLTPTAVHAPIRLVHAGGAMPGRKIELMMQAAARTRTDLELTLYLTSSSPSYLAQLRELAAELGPRIHVEPAVPSTELLDILNTYDVGIHLLPPTVTNQALALPNKFFDFVQARLGVIVGPTPGMASLVEHHGLGAVTAGFAVEDIVSVLDALSPERVEEWKAAADAASDELSAERQMPVWATAIAQLGG